MSTRVRSLFPDQPGEFVLRDPAGNEVMRVPWMQAPPTPPAEQPGTGERALKRGALNVASDFSTTGGLLAEALGSDEFAQGFYDKATEFSQRAAQYQPTIGGIENIQNLGDLAVYGFEVLAENAPMIASLAVPGGLVAKGAQLAGAGARGASVAGTTAAFLSDVGLQTGESGSIAREGDQSPVDIRVVGSGIGKAALDFVPLLALARRFGLAKNLPIGETMERILVGNMAEGGFLRRAAGHAGAIVAREVPTETAQEYINVALNRTIQDYGGDLTEEEISQLKNAAAGATVFGILGVPAAIRKPAPQPDTPPPDARTPHGLDLQEEQTRTTLTFDTAQPDGGFSDFALQGDVFIEPDGPATTLAQPREAVLVEDAKLPKLEAVAETPYQLDAAVNALKPEPEIQDTSFYVDINGVMETGTFSDPMARTDLGPDAVSQGLAQTREQLEVAASFPEYAKSDPSTPEAQALAYMHPGLIRLNDLRAEVIADEDNYRTTDGRMKKAAENRVERLDTRIASLLGKLGLQPVETGALEATPENLQQGERIVEEPPKALSDGQKRRLERLAEKEQIEGLTEIEYEDYAELIGIAAGEFGPVERQKVSQSELTDLDTIAKQVRKDETVRQRTVDKVNKFIPGTGLTAAQAQVALRDFSKNFKYGPKVRLLSRNHPEVHERLTRYDREIRGWWDPKTSDTIQIVPTNHSTEKDLYATYLHETLVHYGLNSFMTERESVRLLVDLAKAAPPGFDVEGIRRQYESDGQIAPVLIEAEEYIARVAETAIIDPNNGVVKMPWWKRFLAFLKRKLRLWTGKNFRWSDNDLVFILRDMSKLLTGLSTPGTLVVPGQEFARDNEMMRTLDDDVADSASSAVDSSMRVWGARWAKMFLTPLQFASKYNVPGSKEFLDFTQQWWARKRVLTDTAAQLSQTFMKLGRRDQIKLSEAVLKMSIKSDELGRKLIPKEINEVFEEVGISKDDALVNLWSSMDKSFQDMVTQLRSGLETIAIRTQGRPSGEKLSRDVAKSLQRQYTKSKAGTSADRKSFIQEVGPSVWLRLQEIDEEMKQLEDRNYFPRMRFGNWAITVRAQKDLSRDGKVFKGPTQGERGEVVYFETFESQAAQEEAFEDLKKDFPKGSFQMQLGKIAENQFHFMGSISPQLYEQLMGTIPDMTDSQKEVLRELYLKQAPGRSFLRHLTKRKGVNGYSEDVLRVYASYMMNVANHIARVEYHIDMNESLGVIQEEAANVTPDARVTGIVSEYFQDQYDYLMNPKNDLAHLRAMGFLWYLGANVKSAVVNLTQVPMVAYPFLASKYGDARSSAALLNALQLVTRKVRNGEILSPELRTQLDRAVREGFVDESRATELAGLAEQDVLQRLIPESRTGRKIANASYYGAWLFQKAERFNREVTFIAAYNLAKQNGVTSQEEAFRQGREAVQTAMFEYAKWNRPAFMRGKKSVFFLFWQYMQGLSYMAFGGAGSGAAMRLWMMLLLAGGLQGLPFAENILDILDFVGTKTKERLGMSDPRVDLRNDLRELATEITDRPDLIMHGLSRYYGLGPLHLLNMFEIPVPNVDISGSISAGRVIPGTEDFLSHERDPSAKLGRTLVDAFGPVAGIPYQIWRAALDTNPDTWKVWERTLPSAFKNMSAAARRGYRGEETFRGGGQIAEFDPQDTEHRAEVVANFLGFAPTRVNQRYEVDFSVENMKKYWALRRALVMENVAYARMAGDPEGIKDSMRALHEFNSSVPDGLLRVNLDQLMRSLKQRFRKASLRERGIPSEQLYRRIVSSMRELYPETEVDIQ